MIQLSQNRDMTLPELNAYFDTILDEREPLDTTAMPSAEIEALIADLRPRIQGASLMQRALGIGVLHCQDEDAVARATTRFVELTYARAFDRLVAEYGDETAGGPR